MPISSNETRLMRWHYKSKQAKQQRLITENRTKRIKPKRSKLSSFFPDYLGTNENAYWQQTVRKVKMGYNKLRKAGLSDRQAKIKVEKLIVEWLMKKPFDNQ